MAKKKNPKPGVDIPSEFLLRYLLSAVYWFDDGLQMHMEAKGWPRMSRTKSLILTSIANGIHRPSSIAETLGLTRQAVHLAIGELEQQKLVNVKPDPNDKRANLVTFRDAAQGKKMRDTAVSSLARIESVLRDRLGEELFEGLLMAMKSDWREPVSPSDRE